MSEVGKKCKSVGKVEFVCSRRGETFSNDHLETTEAGRQYSNRTSGLNVLNIKVKGSAHSFH